MVTFVLAAISTYLLFALTGRRLIIPPTQQGDQNLRGIAADSCTKQLIAVADGGTVLRGAVKDDQVRWEKLTQQHSNQNLRGIAAVPNTNLLIAVGDGGTLLCGTVRNGQV